jgi:hypothetical protein
MIDGVRSDGITLMPPTKPARGHHPSLPPETVSLGLVWAAYAAFAYVAADRGWPVVCPFRLLTGIRCPLCGLTTGTGRLLRGDFRGAFAAHWLAPVGLPAAGVWLATRAAARTDETRKGGS